MIAKLFGRGGQSSCVFCDIISSKDMSKIIYEVSISWVLLRTHKLLLLKFKSNQLIWILHLNQLNKNLSISLIRVRNMLMNFYEDSYE